MQCHTFVMNAGSDDVQEQIDQDNQCEPGHIIALVPEGRGVASGDGAVIECSDPGCKCCWIGDVEDVEDAEDGSLRVLIRVR